jgi:hypothetical protein
VSFLAPRAAKQSVGLREPCYFSGVGAIGGRVTPRTVSR